MRLCNLETVMQLRQQYRDAVRAFDEVARLPRCFFPLGTSSGYGSSIAKLRGADVLPLLGKNAARIAVDLLDMGIDMQGDISEHLTPYILAIKDEKTADSGGKQA
ncbi:hypothetical protein ACBR42_13035 [Komagataeibacter sp. SM21]